MKGEEKADLHCDMRDNHARMTRLLNVLGTEGHGLTANERIHKEDHFRSTTSTTGRKGLSASSN